jgi:carotenoid cleavage dioxygenase-like enzyme
MLMMSVDLAATPEKTKSVRTMDNMDEEEDKPFWLKGNMAPVQDEATVFDLPVGGSIPPELDGLYARNGANPRDGHSGHWFFGDGMVHGVSLRNGKAQWYRNRWVRTPVFDGDKSALSRLRGSVANTSVVAHAGRIFALVENALPVELSPELGTLGYFDFAGRLDRPCTAHPKICPVTGELHFFGYSLQPPYLTYHAADREGRLTHSLEVPLEQPCMMHDFALTRNHVIFMDLPVVFDDKSALKGTMPFAWSDERGARLGLLPRGAGIEALRWVEIEPCYVYHTANAFEEADGSIIVDAARYRELWRNGPSSSTFERAKLHRWHIAPRASKATEEPVDGRPVEFPRINDGHAGLPHDIVYALGTGGDIAGGGGELIKFDMRNGKGEVKVFEAGLPSEFAFVPAGSGDGEDEGWLLGFVYDRRRNSSDLFILDAQNIEGEAVARVVLPRRVPQGFHGNWIPVESMSEG